MTPFKEFLFNFVLNLDNSIYSRRLREIDESNRKLEVQIFVQIIILVSYFQIEREILNSKHVPNTLYRSFKIIDTQVGKKPTLKRSQLCHSCKRKNFSSDSDNYEKRDTGESMY